MKNKKKKKKKKGNVTAQKRKKRWPGLENQKNKKKKKKKRGNVAQKKKIKKKKKKRGNVAQIKKKKKKKQGNRAALEKKNNNNNKGNLKKPTYICIWAFLSIKKKFISTQFSFTIYFPSSPSNQTHSKKIFISIFSPKIFIHPVSLPNKHTLKVKLRYIYNSLNKVQ